MPHFLLSLVDFGQQYGRDSIKRFAQKISKADLVCDLGVGTGIDLTIIKKVHPGARLCGLDFTNKLISEAAPLIELHLGNIESDQLPFNDETVDIVVANQILEHIKEIFWVSDQVSRKLKVGGYFIIGVPNISSLHNRILFLFGAQPSQMKTNSAHVRGFSTKELPHFFERCWPGGYKLVERRGSQFYPFPGWLAQLAARLFPGLAFSNFYLFKKVKSYNGEFLEYPAAAGLETNFFIG